MKSSDDSYTSFPSTHWSVVQAAPLDEAAFTEFIRAYLRPMRSFLKRCGLSLSHSEDCDDRNELNRNDTDLPRRIAKAIYFTSIAGAWVRLDVQISSTPPQVLRSGFEMLLGCDWLPPWQRQLLLDARQRAEPQPSQ